MGTKTNGTRNKQFQRTHGKGSFNDALKELRKEQQEQKEKESALLRKNRMEDLEFLGLVCEALNNRIKSIMKLQIEAEASGRNLSKEDTKVSLRDVEAFFKSIDQKFPMKNRVAVLIAPLVDLAKCQVNTKLLDYHVAIRMVYFGERFQAYFSPEFDQARYDLMKEFEDFLFFKWNLTHVAFINHNPGNDDSAPLSELMPENTLVMPINLVGIDVKVDFHHNKEENCETSDLELEKKADQEAEENSCDCGDNHPCGNNCCCHNGDE